MVIYNLLNDLRIQNKTVDYQNDILVDIEIEDRVNYNDKYYNQTLSDNPFI